MDEYFRFTRVSLPPTRVLNFDIEARPLGWYGGDLVHKEVTAIASAWEDDPDGTLEVLTLSNAPSSAQDMLLAFRERYMEATLLAGHYVRGFDLPTLQAAYVEHELPLLPARMVSDTKEDLVKMSGISKSQENLASWLGLSAPKVKMTMEDWRQANRLTPAGLKLVVERAGGDVLQNIEMRGILQARGLLGKPKLWDPGTPGRTTKYTP